MIDSKKLYKWIKAEINPYGKPFEGTVFEFGNKVLDHIKAMEKQPKTDWIPCEERLPEDDDEEYYPMCLVTLDNGEVCTGVYRTKDKVWYTRMCEGETVYTKEHKVLAWQPLPQPYEKEGADDEG